MSGVRKACQGRPVTEGDLAVLAQKVEESVRQTGVVADRHERDRPRDPRAAARARRGRLPAVRERLPGVRLARGLRVRHRPAARRPPAPALARPRHPTRRLSPAGAGRDRIAWRGCIPSSSGPSCRAWTPRPPTTPRWPSSGCWASRRSPGRRARSPAPTPSLATSALGLRFDSPFGVAAGFDKDVRGVARPVRARLRPRRGRHADGDPAGRQPAAAAVPPHPGPRRRQPHGLQQPRRRSGGRRASRSSAGAGRRAVIGVNIGKSRVVDVADATADYVAQRDAARPARRLPRRQRLVAEHPGPARAAGRRDAASAARGGARRRRDRRRSSSRSRPTCRTTRSTRSRRSRSTSASPASSRRTRRSRARVSPPIRRSSPRRGRAGSRARRSRRARSRCCVSCATAVPAGVLRHLGRRRRDRRRRAGAAGCRRHPRAGLHGVPLPRPAVGAADQPRPRRG